MNGNFDIPATECTLCGTRWCYLFSAPVYMLRRGAFGNLSTKDFNGTIRSASFRGLPSIMWVGPLIFNYHHRGCLNNIIFPNLGLCACWALSGLPKSGKFQSYLESGKSQGIFFLPSLWQPCLPSLWQPCLFMCLIFLHSLLYYYTTQNEVLRGEVEECWIHPVPSSIWAFRCLSICQSIYRNIFFTDDISDSSQCPDDDSNWLIDWLLYACL